MGGWLLGPASWRWVGPNFSVVGKAGWARFLSSVAAGCGWSRMDFAIGD